MRLRVDARPAPAGIVRELAGAAPRLSRARRRCSWRWRCRRGARLLELGAGLPRRAEPDFFAEVRRCSARPPSRRWRPRRATAADVAAGVAWLALVPASLLHRSGDLSFDGYYRVVAVPLVLLARGVGPARAGLAPARTCGRASATACTLAGLALAAAGTALEFWGGWAAGEESARRPGAPDEAGWWGSDVGSALVLFGVMALFAGGPTAAVALRGALPFWASRADRARSGFGVLSAHASSTRRRRLATVPVFGAFGAGWLALGLLVRRSPGRLGGARAAS